MTMELACGEATSPLAGGGLGTVPACCPLPPTPRARGGGVFGDEGL
jgi:hypothetical protein